MFNTICLNQAGLVIWIQSDFIEVGGLEHGVVVHSTALMK